MENEIVQLRLKINDLAKEGEQDKKTIDEYVEQVKSLEDSLLKYEKMLKSTPANTQSNVSIDGNNLASSEESVALNPDDLITVLANQRNKYKRRSHDFEDVSSFIIQPFCHNELW